MMAWRQWTKIYIFQLFGFITVSGIVVLFMAFNIVAIFESSLFPVGSIKSSNLHVPPTNVKILNHYAAQSPNANEESSSNAPLPRLKIPRHHVVLTPNSYEASAYYQMQVQSMRRHILENRRVWEVRAVP
jgi:hypothetical protein